jgi:hypothetical protein
VSLRSYLLTLIAILIVLLVLCIWFYPSSGDFRVENPGWNGAEALTVDYHALPLSSLADLPPSPAGASLIVIPYLDFKTSEMEQLRSFVSHGSRLILADDFGYGNRVLEYLGLKARFAGNMLLDPLVNYKNGRMPGITRLLPDALTANTDNLVLNHATCLVNVSGNETIALSSPFSFLDLNSNGTHEDDEFSGPLPVISRHRLGDGEVILIADPSIFINSMANIGGNAVLINNIAAGTEVLYIDQSHLEQPELYLAKNWLHRGRQVAATSTGTSGLVIIALTASLIPVWYRIKGSKGDKYDNDAGKKTADIKKHYR